MIRITAILFILILLPLTTVFGIERYPPPQFESGYQMPHVHVPPAQADFYGILDAAALFTVLLLTAYLAHKRRSRRGILGVSLFSLVYYGGWRKGFFCIGSFQNIALALFSSSYAIPGMVLAFFLFSLLFTLLFGRVFCGAFCPHGVLQDVVLVRPIKVPSWLEHALGLIPFVYLGAAVLFAATGSVFIAGRYDPFVTFFPRIGDLTSLLVGVGVILVSMFIGRPYCRFLCPYGALLKLISKMAIWHVELTNKECIECQLCEDACPYGAINEPSGEPKLRNLDQARKRLARVILMFPLLLILGGWLGYQLSNPFSRMHPTVRLAERIWLEDAGQVEGTTDESAAFRDRGEPVEQLYAQAGQIKQQFVWGTTILGIYLGLLFGIKATALSLRPRSREYRIDHGACYSCGRCFKACPVENGIPLEEALPQA